MLAHRVTLKGTHGRTLVLAVGVLATLAVGTPAATGQPHPGQPHPAVRPPLPEALPAPAGHVDEGLSDVRMVSASDGWAVGHVQRGQTPGALIEHWDGSSWTAVKGLPFAGFLSGVSADSASDAWVAGASNDGENPLLAHWDGTRWTEVKSADPGGSQGTILESVTALSPTNAWAVGEYDESSPKTFIEHWNGRVWKQSTSVNPGRDNELATVDAISPTDIWAAGETFERAQFQTLVEHWDGRRWHLVPSQNTEDASFLTNLSANSAADLWAVGYSYINSGRKALTVTLTEHWNGSRWKVVPSPTQGHRFGTFLDSVSTVTSRDAWAAGLDVDSRRAFMLHWNGRAWTKVSVPNPGGSLGDELLGLDALSPSDVWSVGGYGKSAHEYLSLHEHWNGHGWTVP